MYYLNAIRGLKFQEVSQNVPTHEQAEKERLREAVAVATSHPSIENFRSAVEAFDRYISISKTGDGI